MDYTHTNTHKTNIMNKRENNTSSVDSLADLVNLLTSLKDHTFT